MLRIALRNSLLRFDGLAYGWARFVLFGFRPRWALHLGRSASNHSSGYAFSADRTTCLAHLALIPEPLMKCAG